MTTFKNILSKAMLFALPVLGGAGGAGLLSSCVADKTINPSDTPREFMTMFINDNTRGKGSDYPFNCGIDGAYPHGNTIHLYWYGVNDCAGYQIQMALSNKVANGADAWKAAAGTSAMILDTVVGPEVLDLKIQDLPYSVDYRFAIRTLSKKDAKGDYTHASNWWGHGNGREWQDWMGITTNKRYETPYAVYVDQSKTTETTLNVCLNPNILDVLKKGDDGKGDFTPEERTAIQAEFLATKDMKDNVKAVLSQYVKNDQQLDKLDSYVTNFNVDPATGDFGFKELRVSRSPSNPGAALDAKWEKYTITKEDLAKKQIIVTGLSKNATYVIDVVDTKVTTPVDAKYNTCTTRTDGTPGDPILLTHDEMIQKYASAGLANMPGHESLTRDQVFGNLATKYDAAPISPVLYDFISNADLAEGQTFILEGGKTYYIDGNDITCKGFVLRTNPADVQQGKRAKVICGIGSNSQIYSGTNGDQWQGSFTMFMFGRQPEAGEGGEIYMKKLAFYDIDFDNPTSLNYGDNQAGAGTIAGNYFFNMYSDGMAVTLDSLVIDNCSFKRIVRGFIREQGVNYKVWKHVLIHNNQFMDCGFYSNGAGGYPWIAGSGNSSLSNLYEDMQVTENTFFDSPFPSFFNETSQANWESGAWNITFSNNTLVNFNTRAAGNIFNMRNLPDGSVFNCKNNLMVLCKKAGDQRVLGAWGADIRETMVMPDGSSAHVTLNFENNWSTNNDLTNGQIFSGNPWTSTSNNWQKLVKNNLATLNGTLEVKVANISAIDLMVQPCPPFVATTASSQHMHRADALDGSAGETGADLNFTAKGKSSEIATNQVGAARWRNGSAAKSRRRF